ncbi:MAG TPA: ECF transporter S component [Firmicutes bacterium]|nr:ECF transporter S component [Bacillota bacterium]
MKWEFSLFGTTVVWRLHYAVSLLIIVCAMIPFFMTFEKRKPQARELVVIATLSALAVAGRAAFFMLPQFKPVCAIVIIAGVCFGAESGFLVGAVTGFVSNFFFGQGIHTPWQMFCFGVVGFLAGILFRKGLLPKRPVPLCIYGGLSVFLLYGGIINLSTLLGTGAALTWPMVAAKYLSALPFDLLHAAATVFFLLVLSRPMIEKLERIKVKYGLIQP